MHSECGGAHYKFDSYAMDYVNKSDFLEYKYKSSYLHMGRYQLLAKFHSHVSDVRGWFFFFC